MFDLGLKPRASAPSLREIYGSSSLQPFPDLMQSCTRSQLAAVHSHGRRVDAAHPESERGYVLAKIRLPCHVPDANPKIVHVDLGPKPDELRVVPVR